MTPETTGSGHARGKRTLNGNQFTSQQKISIFPKWKNADFCFLNKPVLSHEIYKQSSKPFKNFFYIWPRNFGIAFWIELIIAQPIARFVMKKLHQSQAAKAAAQQ